jgi:UDP-perosamine 4-acetyltransferase
MNILIIGAGGHAKVLLDALQTQPNVTVIGILEINPAYVGKEIFGVKVLVEEHINQYPPQQVKLVNGLGSISIPKQRQLIFNKFKSLGYEFFSVQHANAGIAQEVVLSEGVQVMAGSVIQTGCRIGRNVIVNTRTAIDHDCQISDHVHLAPGVTLCGDVVIGETSHIGAGAIITQGIKIGKQCLVGAGAVVIRDVPSDSQVMGVPATKIKIKEDIEGEKLE